MPAGVANMAAGVSGAILKKLDYPIDFRKKFRGKRLLGDHKTFRGAIFGIIAGFIVYLIQGYLANNSPMFYQISVVDYSNLFIGFLLGFGAVLGDVVKSFFKRQADIPPGESWFPFDQLDWLAGSLFLVYFIEGFSIGFLIGVMVFGLALHVIVKMLGYLLGLQDSGF